MIAVCPAEGLDAAYGVFHEGETLAFNLSLGHEIAHFCEPGVTILRIEANEASGIIAWHPDRLARNSVDGGQIVYLLDQTHLQALKFPTFWFENTSQGKFMLSIAFGQSKY